jgi:hypothetical protein
MAAPPRNDFRVRFSRNLAKVVEVEAPSGLITFTLDSGSSGDRSICLEHHPSSWPRTDNYNLAFESAKRYLESCGYEVETGGR